MVFNPVQVEGEWFVRSGRKFFPSTKSATEQEARNKAAKMTAQWHVKMIKKAMAEMDETAIDEMKEIGFSANSVVDRVTDWLGDNDPEQDDRDSRGWLC